MSRVLLFVQTGEGRPKSVGLLASAGTITSMAVKYGGAYERVAPGVWLSPGKIRARDRADRWWLVECENAEAGRQEIACAETTCDHQHYAHCGTTGRILASGGRAA